MTRPTTTGLLGFSSIALSFVFYRAAVDVSHNLSPQGCRMSWMYPSYVPQTEFNSSWTPLASRYSLWLYREADRESDEIRGTPVLFIPGNAGSSHQVRSIASSAANQFYSKSRTISPEFEGHRLKSLDFFAVEFNEDLSALYGPTIESQVAYCSKAISYILAQYPPGTTIIIIGHSMGGIVATSLLPSRDISAIITMSTPHTLPPARFDSRIEHIYQENFHTLLSDPTPIISLCGGATDMMISSESCELPALDPGTDVYRRSVFTTALEGTWTGVGHREMVWCHQVRWRVARAALELGAAHSAAAKGLVLDTWLRDGQVLPPAIMTTSTKFTLSEPGTYQIHRTGVNLVLKSPHRSSVHLLPVSPASTPSKAVLFVSQGSILPVGPRHAVPLRVSVHLCSRTAGRSEVHPTCVPLLPETLKLIPNPSPGGVFPVPGEGPDESEGVVLFEADIPIASNSEERWVGVHVEEADGRGWVVGGLASDKPVTNPAGSLAPFLGGVSVSLPTPNALRTFISLPNILNNAVIVYRVASKGGVSTACTAQLLSPLLSHVSHLEAQYYPLVHSPSLPILLHTHSSAPYISDRRPLPTTGLNFAIYSTGSSECFSDVSEVEISVDWWSTIGRWATRYPTTVASWAVGVVTLMLFAFCTELDQSGSALSVQMSLRLFGSKILPKLLASSLAVACLPLPKIFYLGNGGISMFAPLAPLLLLLAAGMVIVSWWFLQALMWPLGKISGKMSRKLKDDGTGDWSVLIVPATLLLVTFYIPWQVAFFGSWLVHLHTCASSSVLEHPTPSRGPPISLAEDGLIVGKDSRLMEKQRQSHHQVNNDYNYNMHLLLLMTWLLPFVVPVLAVWVRTLMTAGLTTPFSGDHSAPDVLPFLVFVYVAGWTKESLFTHHSYQKGFPFTRWSFIVLSAVAFFIGPRKTYFVLDATKLIFNVILALYAVLRVWRRH